MNNFLKKQQEEYNRLLKEERESEPHRIKPFAKKG